MSRPRLKDPLRLAGPRPTDPRPAEPRLAEPRQVPGRSQTEPRLLLTRLPLPLTRRRRWPTRAAPSRRLPLPLP